jgi:hypothetical protein
MRFLVQKRQLLLAADRYGQAVCSESMTNESLKLNVVNKMMVGPSLSFYRK